MENGALAHRTKRKNKRMENLYETEYFNMAGQFPNMNSIENMWHILQQNLHKRNLKSNNNHELMQV